MKLINFTDHDGNQVWINPEKVCRVLTRKDHCSIYTEDGGMTWLAMPATIAIDILKGKAVILGEKSKPKKGTKK